MSDMRAEKKFKVGDFDVTVFEMSGEDIDAFFNFTGQLKEDESAKDKENILLNKIESEGQGLYKKILPVIPRIVTIRKPDGNYLTAEEVGPFIFKKTPTTWLMFINSFKEVNSSFLSILDWLGLVDVAPNLIRAVMQTMASNLEGLLPRLMQTALAKQKVTDILTSKS